MLSTLRNTRTFALVVLVVVAVACLLRLPSRTEAEPAGATASPELAKLQQEQIATLHEALNMANQMFAAGTGSIEEANRFNHMLIEAQLKAATSLKERMGILRDGLAAAKSQEDLATQKAKLGLATALAPVEAKAYRLGFEVKLAEENVK